MSFGAVTAASSTLREPCGPAIGVGKLTETHPYMFAQFIGAGVAALLYRLISNRSIGDEKDKAAADEPAF
jgi:glycerol uptake facilitator-like aquaporin